MKKLLVIMLLVLSVTTNAQPKYFEKSLGWEYIHNGWKVFERTDGNYFLACDARSYDTGIWNAYGLLLNVYGDSINTNSTSIPDNYGVAINAGMATEYGYAISGYIGTNLSNPIEFQNYILRLNENGELIDSTWIGVNISCSYTIARTPDNGYLLGGYSRDPSGFSPHPYLIRLNANMEVLWDTTYIISNLGFGLGNFNKLIADTTDNTYYALATVSSEPYDLVWLHLDDTGQILGHRVFPSTPYDVINDIPSISIWGRDMIRCNDGDFLIGLSRIQLDDPIGAYLVKMSPDGDTLRWIKNIDTAGYVTKIHQLADGSFILGGSAYRLQNGNESLEDVVVHVSKDGDILWKRIYGGDENDYIYDFIPTSDGGYFFTGRTESNLPNGGANVYLLKTNCMGLLTEPQAAFAATIDTASLTAVFHNLSQFVYLDSIDGGHFVWDFGDGTFSSDINPTHTYAQSGSYEVTLTAVVCSDTSVVEQEVSTWVVGISAPLNDHPWSLSEAEVQVLPNPAQDYLVVENHSLEQSASFVLYDIMGKEVARQALSVNSTTVKTEHLPSGVYLYHILNPQKQILTYGKLSIVR